MRGCSDDNVNIDGAPSPDNEPSEYLSEGLQMTNGNSQKWKEEWTTRRKQCLSNPVQGSGIRMLKKTQVEPQEGETIYHKQRNSEGIVEEAYYQHTGGTKRRAGDKTCRHQYIVALYREVGRKDKKWRREKIFAMQWNKWYNGMRGAKEMKQKQIIQTSKLGFQAHLSGRWI